jgi:hypothetical protein
MNTNSGFTLIETLVYLGLYALLMSGVITALYAISTTSATSITDTDIHDEGVRALDTIRRNWEIASYMGEVAVPVVDSYVKIAAFSTIPTIDHLLVQFSISATTSNGSPRTQVFSESLFSFP